MCPPKNSSAAAAKKAAKEAKKAEELRQARIAQGQNNIDQSFDGFNDDYFRGFRKDYEGYYLPELDDQYARAREQTTFQLFRQMGGDEHSAGAKKRGRLHRTYLDGRTDVANKALNAVNDLRSRIEDTKSNLYAFNASAADPGQALSRSTALAGNLQQPIGYGPLHDVFASALNSGATVVGAERQGYRGTGTGLFSPKGSDSYVR
jgi:hypothetical protein